ncbi:hypothetical protein [Nonomuraea indica]|uniref:hypothetical protein n=1 Tax=Nonomuraea indica TaxID=1581193 RepID=UPI000C7C3515|nr:hypothetical protein [Nonomuraea indica]
MLPLAVAVTALSLSTNGVAAADPGPERPLAPLAKATAATSPPQSAIEAMEAVNRATLAEPTQWAGTWYDATTGRVVTAVAGGASEGTRKEAWSKAGSDGTVVQVERSFADLAQLSDTIMQRGSIASVGIVSAAMDWERNGLVVGLEKVTDEARAALAADYGDIVTVRQMTPPRDHEGPSRLRDRYPYWGASGWAPPRAGQMHCSTSFPMKRPDGSKHFLVTAAHCNHPYQLDAATMNSSETSWSNVIGTSKGYQSSFCQSTGESCDIGSTKYGDISVIKVDGVAPRIYTGGPDGTSSAAVVSTQTGLPAVNDSMCASGARTGTTCGYKITDNFMSVRNSEGKLRTPVVMAENLSGACIYYGDSGGAVYKPVTGGVRASGVISAVGSIPGGCALFYTSISYAQQLFDAEVVTTS